MRRGIIPAGQASNLNRSGTGRSCVSDSISRGGAICALWAYGKRKRWHRTWKCRMEAFFTSGLMREEHSLINVDSISYRKSFKTKTQSNFLF